MRVIAAALLFFGLTSVMELAASEARLTAPSPSSAVSDSDSSRVDTDGWIRWFNTELRAVDAQRTTLRSALDRLGAPVIGQTAPQFGHQNQRLNQTQPPLSPPWVQVDLQEDVAIDRIALIPAVLDWQSDTKRTYGFPPRFRIDISSNAEFTDPISVADFTEHDQPDPGIAPLVVRVEHRRARYVRVTITKLVIETGQYFYALGELMVLSGQRNVAINRPITASSGMNIPPRWTKPNLVDGRTALGPPIHVELLKWDGLYAGTTKTEPFSYMAVDLGKEFALQEVRIYAVHARLGADIPGYLFPTRFRVEAARSADFSDAVTILNALDADYPNPGNNAITIRTTGITARHVRVSLPNGDKRRFGLSEIEVYANDHNVAREGRVTSTVDPSSFSGSWPRSLLVDGFTSYGRLMELPDWLDEWGQRAQLTAELMKLDERRPRLLSEARKNAWWTGGSVAALTMIAASIVMVVSRRRRAHELDQLRRRLARDLHDEIGSNLAAIARLSELGAGQEHVASVATAAGDWNEVNRIAHESMDGMREILWLAGAREESGPDLASHLQRLVERMLGGVEVRWTAPLEALPTNWQPAARRELFLMVKEALTNVVRHAQAKFIELGFVVDGAELQLEIRDHGKGFDLTTVRDGMGLNSLRERARILGGKLTIKSVPGTGTTILFTVPVAKLQASASGSARTSSVSSLS